MSQTNISTKYAITAITGTIGSTFAAAGRDEKQVLAWRDSAGTILSQKTLTISGGLKSDGSTWGSKATLMVPTMEDIATSGSASGYVATPAVAGRTYFNLNTTRFGRLSQADALRSLDEFAHTCLTDAAFRANVVGYSPADA